MEIPEEAVGADRRIIDLAILLANHTGEDNPSDCCLRRDTVRDNIAGLMARIRELEQAIRRHRDAYQRMPGEEPYPTIQTDLDLWALLDGSSSGTAGDVTTAARQLLDALAIEPLDEPLTPRTRNAIDRLRAMLPNT